MQTNKKNKADHPNLSLIHCLENNLPKSVLQQCLLQDNINICNENGLTPLAVALNNSDINLATLELLLENGCDVDQAIVTQGEHYQSAMEYSQLRNLDPEITALLEEYSKYKGLSLR